MMHDRPGVACPRLPSGRRGSACSGQTRLGGPAHFLRVRGGGPGRAWAWAWARGECS
jgi:hypothetical protein